MKLYVLVDEARGVAIMTLDNEMRARQMFYEESNSLRRLQLYEIEATKVDT